MPEILCTIFPISAHLQSEPDTLRAQQSKYDKHEMQCYDQALLIGYLRLERLLTLEQAEDVKHNKIRLGNNCLQAA